VAREKDDDNTDQHCSQVHLTVYILLPVTVSLMRLRRRRGMWHVRKMMIMQTSTAATQVHLKVHILLPATISSFLY
jgi:hypothetical protein